MVNATTPPLDDKWKDLFPTQIDLPPSGHFEIGLVLGGTVSAGAYTAGVIDYLIEALDEWAAARKANPEDLSIPTWTTTIKAISGTSGGGVIAALLGRALSYKFPPIRSGSTTDDHLRNPLYRVWVKELDITGFLNTSDLNDGGQLKSLLNDEPLLACKTLITNFEKSFPTAQRLNRDYIPEPLPIILTLTNLKGIPYRLDMGTGSQSYVDHADYARFAIFTKGSNSSVRPDEFSLSITSGQDCLQWGDYASFVLGTSAFPVGFPSRALSRPMEHLRYRPSIDTTAPYPILPTEIDWQSLRIGTAVPDKYEFAAVDGGMLDNEPLELCRKIMSGWTAHNPRDGESAKRALLLVDPFAESPQLGPTSLNTVTKEILPLLSAWKQQARYDTRDVLLAADAKCFSRFMITAMRPGAEPGGKSIATASVAAFGGFLCEAYRHHDFQLGRANCQEYLRHKFVLPIDNPLFTEWRQLATERELEKWITFDNKSPSLPIIPLLGACSSQEPTAAYPVDEFDVESSEFQKMLNNRIQEIVDRLRHDANAEGIIGTLANAYLAIGEPYGIKKTHDYIVSHITNSLRDWKLIS